MKYRLRLLLHLLPVALLLVLALLVQQHGVLPYLDARYNGDYSNYLALAIQPFGSSNPLAQQAPFLWRLLTPLIVHVLPVSPVYGFWLVTLAGLVGTVLALEWLLSGLGLLFPAVLAGGFAFVLLGPATGFLLWDDMLVDPLALCLLALIVAAAIHQHGKLLLSLVLLGALAKEVTLLGTVFAVLWGWKRCREMVGWSLAALALGMLVQTLLRILILPTPPYTFLSAFEISTGYTSFSPLSFLELCGYEGARLIESLLGAWGIMLPLAVLQLRHVPQFWRTYSTFLVLAIGAILQILIATDLERLVIYGFPAIIAACCFEVEYLAARWQCSRWYFWLPVFFIEGAFWFPYAGWSAITNGKLEQLDAPYRILAGGILALTAGILIWMLLTRKQHARSMQSRPECSPQGPALSQSKQPGPD